MCSFEWSYYINSYNYICIYEGTTSLVVLLGPGKVKNIIIVLNQEHFFVFFIMGIILMVASLVIVDFDIKKMNIIRICVYSCLLLQSFLRITSLFLIFKSTVQICVVTLSCFQNEMNIIMIMYSVCILLTSSANQIEFFF